jgi:hypothetical protein
MEATDEDERKRLMTEARALAESLEADLPDNPKTTA